MRFSPLTAAALALAATASAQVTPVPTSPGPTAPQYFMSAQLGTGIAFTPAEVHFPLGSRAALTTAVTLGGPMRRVSPGIELGDATLTRLALRSHGHLELGIRAYGSPAHTGVYLGGGVAARAFSLEATTYRSTLGGALLNLAFPVARVFGGSFDEIDATTSGLAVGGFAEVGYAYRTRRGRSQHFGLRLDATALRGFGYEAVDGRLGRVRRELDRTAGGLGTAVVATYRFQLGGGGRRRR